MTANVVPFPRINHNQVEPTEPSYSNLKAALVRAPEVDLATLERAYLSEIRFAERRVRRYPRTSTSPPIFRLGSCETGGSQKAS
jgi:hypothetical protein